MRPIYEPKGAAGEYASLGLNLYSGCSHRCRYCYNKNRSNDPCNQLIEKSTLENIEYDLNDMDGGRERVHLCFIGDPYDLGRDDNSYIHEVLKLFKMYGRPFQVLTKGGTKATQDFDLYVDGDRFGSTLTFINDEDSKKWEPGAALPQDRLDSLRIAHNRGIETWASMEPVIDPSQTLRLIEKSHKFVDFYWIGKLNHDPKTESSIDWVRFRTDVELLLKSLDKNYGIKKDLIEIT
jgi:DNA repair photolyase